MKLNPNLKEFWKAKGIRNRILYGGRMSSKTHDAGGIVTYLANNFKIKILCTRHMQNKLADSVYTLIKDKATSFGWYERFKFTESSIVNRVTGSEFLFYGRSRNLDEIKSLEGVDIHWGEECHKLKQDEWDIIEPTIRKEGSQNWLIFNPKFKNDYVYQRFVVNPPPKTLVRKINYDENPFLSQTALDVIEAKRLESYEEFQHIYLGVPLENNDQSLIKSSWIEAAVDAHIKLGINIEGKRVGSLDVADEGSDLNAFAIRHGILIESVDTWSGKGGDIYASTEQAFRYCDLNNLREFNFDSDGLGAGVRGDARIINEGRAIKIEVTPFRGSASVINANKDVEGLRIIKTRDIIERKNIDFFANYKAQSWYSLRLRFERTYRAVVHGEKYDPEMLISLNSKMQNLNTLKLELEQPVFEEGGSGKMKVDKAPDDQKSPNMADSVMMAFAPQEFRSSLF